MSAPIRVTVCTCPTCKSSSRPLAYWRCSYCLAESFGSPSLETAADEGREHWREAQNGHVHRGSMATIRAMVTMISEVAS